MGFAMAKSFLRRPARALGDWLKQHGKGVDDAVQAGFHRAQDVVDGVKKTQHAAANSSVHGRVALQGGRTATCFTGVASCYL